MRCLIGKFSEKHLLAINEEHIISIEGEIGKNSTKVTTSDGNEFHLAQEIEVIIDSLCGSDKGTRV